LGHDYSSRDAGSPKLIVVDKPDAPQTVIRVQIPGPSLFAKERAPLLLANIAFGGTFTSRLTLNLRERNKFTYGAQSVLAPRLGPSYLVAQSAVFSEQTVPALVEICREFRKMSTGELLPGELKKGLATHRIRLVRSLETQQGLLNLFADSAAAGQSIEERRRFHENVAAQTPAAVAKQARKTFTWDQEANVIILVGDRKLIEAQLASHATEKDGEADCTFPAPEFRDVDGSLLP
jgi:predicted Zn-dependent peptidase